MIQNISKAIHKARKRHDDDGWDWLDVWIDEKCYQDQKIPFALFRVLVKAKNNRAWAAAIMPGQMYESQFNKQDGSLLFYFRTKIEFLPFFKYGVFQGDE